MKVLRADAMGLCFGVRDALAIGGRPARSRQYHDSWRAGPQRDRARPVAYGAAFA